MENELESIEKLKKIKYEFDVELETLKKEKASLLKLYSQKLEEKKIEDIKKSISNLN